MLGFLGVAVALSGGFGDGAANLFGVGLIALASLSYAVATVLAKRCLGGLDPIGLATTQVSLAGAMLLPLALLGPLPTAVSAAPLLAVILLGVVGSGVAYLLYYSLLARISSTQVSAVTYLLPLWGLFWGVVAGEPLSWLSPLGVAVVLTGLLLLNHRAGQGAVRTAQAGS